MDTIVAFLMFGGMILWMLYNEYKTWFGKDDEEDVDSLAMRM